MCRAVTQVADRRIARTRRAIQGDDRNPYRGATENLRLEVRELEVIQADVKRPVGRKTIPALFPFNKPSEIDLLHQRPECALADCKRLVAVLNMVDLIHHGVKNERQHHRGWEGPAQYPQREKQSQSKKEVSSGSWKTGTDSATLAWRRSVSFRPAVSFARNGLR